MRWYSELQWKHRRGLPSAPSLFFRPLYTGEFCGTEESLTATSNGGGSHPSASSASFTSVTKASSVFNCNLSFSDDMRSRAWNFLKLFFTCSRQSCCSFPFLKSTAVNTNFSSVSESWHASRRFSASTVSLTSHPLSLASL